MIERNQYSSGSQHSTSMGDLQELNQILSRKRGANVTGHTRDLSVHTFIRNPEGQFKYALGYENPPKDRVANPLPREQVDEAAQEMHNIEIVNHALEAVLAKVNDKIMDDLIEEMKPHFVRKQVI